MRIIDLEQKTGLDRATIRYYEKEGLISPVRQKNGYRDYSDQDKETLLKIKLLRNLGISLEKIQKIQQGSDDFQEAISEQIQILLENKEGINRSVQVCRLLQSDSASYSTMDADRYLKQLATMPLESRQTAPAPEYKYEFSEPIKREYHPLLHLFARGIDLVSFSLLLLFLQAVVFKAGFHAMYIWPFQWLGMLLWVPVEAVCYRCFGTTPGKWLMGIRLESCDGGRLNFRQAISRAWNVYRYGCGFGIPGWRLWRLFRCYRQYQEEEMDWDDETEISYRPLSSWNKTHTCKLIVGVASIVAMVISTAYAVKLPKNRNMYLNIEQFAESYNLFWKITSDDTAWKLRPDGTFQGEDNGNVFVTIIGDNQYEIPDIVYKLEGEKVVGIFYEERLTNPMVISVVSPRGETAAAALLSAQPKQNLDTLADFSEGMRAAIREALLAGETYVEYRYANVQVIWRMESENVRIGDSAVTEGLNISKDPDAEGKSWAIISLEVNLIS